MQEALVRAFARRGTLEDRNKLRQWLYAIARNAIADYYRTQKSLSDLPEDLAMETEEEDSARALARCLPLFVERLPPPYRRAIQLFELERLTQRETAVRLELSVSGVKSRVRRARGMLATMLRECCDLELDGRGALVGHEPRRGSACPGACDRNDPIPHSAA